MKKTTLATAMLILLMSMTACAQPTTQRTPETEKNTTTTTEILSDSVPQAMENTKAAEPDKSDEPSDTAKKAPATVAKADNLPEEKATEPVIKPTAKPDAAAEEEQPAPRHNPQTNTEKIPSTPMKPEAAPTENLENEAGPALEKEPEKKPETPPEAQPPEPKPKPEETPTVPEVQPIVLDLDGLCRYAIDYAVGTYGYEYWPGMRDGYYPAYTCHIVTVEQGREAVRACVDDLTQTLNARGSSIVEYVDGIGYGMPFDVEIYPDPDGYENSYLVQLYY